MEYEMFSLGNIGGNIVSPLFSAMMASWSPLTDPGGVAPVFLKWRPLLTEEAYNNLLWQHFGTKIEMTVELVLMSDVLLKNVRMFACFYKKKTFTIFFSVIRESTSINPYITVKY